MAVSPEGLGPESNCSGKVQKQLYEYTADPSSRQRGSPTSRNTQCHTENETLVTGSRGEADTRIE
jgi:hypothetical protein